MLARIWAGIVGAVAGAAVGLVVTIVLMQNGTALDEALMATWACAAAGIVVGVIFVRPKKVPPSE